MIDFLSFDWLITPYLIEVFYLLLALIVPFVFIYFMKKSTFAQRRNRWTIRLILLIMVVVFELFWRIVNEFVMVYFKFFEFLQVGKVVIN